MPGSAEAEQLDGVSAAADADELVVEHVEHLEDEDGSAPAEAPGRDLAEALDRLDARLAESQRLLGRQAELTEKLHAENQALRAGELRSAQAPLVRGLIRLCDDLDRLCAVADESAADLSMVRESLLDLLARNGVEAIVAEQGEPFDSRLHSVSGVERTDDEQLDKTVAQVERAGFRWEAGEAIRVAEVRAYRLSDPT